MPGEAAVRPEVTPRRHSTWQAIFRAEMDCYVVVSACPQDILPIHGEGGAPPVDAHFEVPD